MTPVLLCSLGTEPNPNTTQWSLCAHSNPLSVFPIYNCSNSWLFDHPNLILPLPAIYMCSMFVLSHVEIYPASDLLKKNIIFLKYSGTLFRSTLLQAGTKQWALVCVVCVKSSSVIDALGGWILSCCITSCSISIISCACVQQLEQRSACSGNWNNTRKQFTYRGQPKRL